MNKITPPDENVKNVTAAAAPSSKKRITWLDSLKGFAIICVVMGHVVDGYINGSAYPSTVVEEFGIYQALYAFHMPLFFLISGFMFSLAYIDKGGKAKASKLKTQLLDIAAVYVIFSILMVAFKVLCSKFANNPASFSDLINVWWRPIGPYWYLYVLALFYVSNIALAKFKMRAILATFLFILSAFAALLPSLPVLTFYRFFFFLPFFYLGTILQRDGRTPNWGAAIAGLAVGCALCLLFWSHSTESYSRIVSHLPFVNTIVALGLSIFLWKAFSAVKWLDNKTFNICGRYCLEIYVTHCFLTAGFRNVFMALGVTNFWVSLTLNTFLSTLLPILFAMALERFGLHDLLFRPVHNLRRLRSAKEHA